MSLIWKVLPKSNAFACYTHSLETKSRYTQRFGLLNSLAMQLIRIICATQEQDKTGDQDQQLLDLQSFGMLYAPWSCSDCRLLCI